MLLSPPMPHAATPRQPSRSTRPIVSPVAREQRMSQAARHARRATAHPFDSVMRVAACSAAMDSRHSTKVRPRLSWFLTASDGMLTQGTSGSASQAPSTSSYRPPRSTTPSSGLEALCSKRPRAGAKASPSSSATGTGSGTLSSSVAGTPSSSEGGAHAAMASPSPGTIASTPHQSDGDNVVVIEDTVNGGLGGKKKKQKYDVWLEFEELIVNGLPKVKCKWCKKTFCWG